ncbi:gamma-butyrobetaine hydroxylase-like domain-containing protein [Bosea sp. LjRoot237]|uniref:gamma-butyrobetaine hydroxylase-like domain-containing protein n=1 Tax=Bosea sp. LjRoot237 TaxID=3342292 RepID=UPI003ECE2023
MSDWPSEIRLSKDRRTLHVTFESGESHALSAELLRVESPSAEVQGHGPTQKQTVPGKRDVEILKVEPVGHYAVRLTFDDMHDTGIYGWDYLRELGRDGEAKLQAYLDDLAAKGLSRERVRRG